MVLRTHHIGAVALLGVMVISHAGVARAQSSDLDPKIRFSLQSVPKGGLSEDDREAASKYLAENRDRFGLATDEAVSLLAALGRWTDALAPFATPVPRRLARQMSPASPDTTRLIFNQTLLVVSTIDGRIVDRVTARVEHH